MSWTSDDDPVVTIMLKRASTEIYIEPGLTDQQLEASVPARLEQLVTGWQREVVDA